MRVRLDPNTEVDAHTVRLRQVRVVLFGSDRVLVIHAHYACGHFKDVRVRGVCCVVCVCLCVRSFVRSSRTIGSSCRGPMPHPPTHPPPCQAVFKLENKQRRRKAAKAKATAQSQAQAQAKG
jgi:hypothetical protein